MPGYLFPVCCVLVNQIAVITGAIQGVSGPYADGSMINDAVIIPVIENDFCSISG